METITLRGIDDKQDKKKQRNKLSEFHYFVYFEGTLWLLWKRISGYLILLYSKCLENEKIFVPMVTYQ